MPIKCEYRQPSKNLLDKVGKVEGVEEEISPRNAREATEEEAAGERSPTIGCLELVSLLLATGESERGCDRRATLLELRHTVDCEAYGQDDNEPGSAQ